MPKRGTKRTPSAALSRQNKKLKYNRVQNRILRAAPVLGGKFTTHAYMHGENGWIDAHFLGKKQFVSYSLAIQTTRCEYKELVSARAWDMSFDLVPEDESWLFDAQQAGAGVSRLNEATHSELGNMTRLDWAHKQEQKIADSGEIQVFERWTLHHNYHSGIGLHATIDVPFLTIEAVNDFIDRFLLSESAFRDSVPRTYRYDQIPDWGIDSNAIIDPWDWASAVGASHATPVDGNVFLDLGFEQEEATRLQADSQWIIEGKLAGKVKP